LSRLGTPDTGPLGSSEQRVDAEYVEVPRRNERTTQMADLTLDDPLGRALQSAREPREVRPLPRPEFMEEGRRGPVPSPFARLVGGFEFVHADESLGVRERQRGEPDLPREPSEHDRAAAAERQRTCDAGREVWAPTEETHRASDFPAPSRFDHLGGRGGEERRKRDQCLAPIPPAGRAPALGVSDLAEALLEVLEHEGPVVTGCEDAQQGARHGWRAAHEAPLASR